MYSTVKQYTCSSSTSPNSSLYSSVAWNLRENNPIKQCTPPWNNTHVLHPHPPTLPSIPLLPGTWGRIPQSNNIPHHKTIHMLFIYISQLFPLFFCCLEPNRKYPNQTIYLTMKQYNCSSSTSPNFSLSSSVVWNLRENTPIKQCTPPWNNTHALHPHPPTPPSLPLLSGTWGKIPQSNNVLHHETIHVLFIHITQLFPLFLCCLEPEGKYPNQTIDSTMKQYTCSSSTSPNSSLSSSVVWNLRENTPIKQCTPPWNNTIALHPHPPTLPSLPLLSGTWGKIPQSNNVLHHETIQLLFIHIPQLFPLFLCCLEPEGKYPNQTMYSTMKQYNCSSSTSPNSSLSSSVVWNLRENTPIKQCTPPWNNTIALHPHPPTLPSLPLLSGTWGKIPQSNNVLHHETIHMFFIHIPQLFPLFLCCLEPEGKYPNQTMYSTVKQYTCSSSTSPNSSLSSSVVWNLRENTPIKQCTPPWNNTHALHPHPPTPPSLPLLSGTWGKIPQSNNELHHETIHVLLIHIPQLFPLFLCCLEPEGKYPNQTMYLTMKQYTCSSSSSPNSSLSSSVVWNLRENNPIKKFTPPWNNTHALHPHPPTLPSLLLLLVTWEKISQSNNSLHHETMHMCIPLTLPFLFFPVVVIRPQS